MTVPAPPDNAPLDADVILASASPRRRELLERIGLRLHVMPVDIDETPLPGEKAREYVRRVADSKCTQAAALHPPIGVPILAADTTVILDGAILGKPRGADDAAAMLGRLAGQRHEVTTAYSIRFAERVVARAVTTQVSMRLIAPEEIIAYVESGEWTDKAGGYAVQGKAALFVTELRGSPTNVIGLPLAEVIADLRALGALSRYPRPGFDPQGERG